MEKKAYIMGIIWEIHEKQHYTNNNTNKGT